MSSRRWFFSMAGRGMAAAIVAPAVLLASTEQAQATIVTINTLSSSPARQFVNREIEDRRYHVIVDPPSCAKCLKDFRDRQAWLVAWMEHNDELFTPTQITKLLARIAAGDLDAVEDELRDIHHARFAAVAQMKIDQASRWIADQ